jgi:hypothetical protein
MTLLALVDILNKANPEVVEPPEEKPRRKSQLRET